jgi:hypothetical protein
MATEFIDGVIAYGPNSAKGSGHPDPGFSDIPDCGVWADAAQGAGVLGTCNNGCGAVGMVGDPAATQAPHTISAGVMGSSKNSPGLYGVSDGKEGVVGLSTGGSGMRGQSATGEGVVGLSTGGSGMRGQSATGQFLKAGVVGQNTNFVGIGVCGLAFGQIANGVVGAGGQRGVWGLSYTGDGVQGQSGQSSGVFGISSSGEGVRGVSISGPGVYGHSYGGKAGAFDGDVVVTGTINKGATAFRIDHPLDPRNKYLYHSGVESPDMKNIYDGIVVLNSRGEAQVALPAWFGALNKDFRYQLTAVGASAPNLRVSREVSNNRFGIAGGPARIKVCWQVTGIRRDAYANAHRIPVEQAKPAKERGLFLHPVENHQAKTKRLYMGTPPEPPQKDRGDFARLQRELRRGPRLVSGASPAKAGRVRTAKRSSQ